MNWLALIPTAVSLVTNILHKEQAVAAPGSGGTKKTQVLAAVSDVANVSNAAFGFNLSGSEVSAHLSTAIDEVVWWLNFAKVFKRG